MVTSELSRRPSAQFSPHHPVYSTNWFLLGLDFRTFEASSHGVLFKIEVIGWVLLYLEGVSRSREYEVSHVQLHQSTSS